MKKDQPFLPFQPESETSRAAARSKRLTVNSDENRVYQHIRRQDEHGATDDEIEMALGLLHQNASARRRGLVLKGLVRDSGFTRKTRTGRAATVWVTNDE